MVRPINYDPLEVRSAALMAFYRKGFAETSLVDLEQATGLNRRQLYNNFGDKRALFLLVLDDFQEAAGRQFLHHLERQGAGLGAIEATLKGMLALVDTERGRLGCLICNASREVIASDKVVGKKVNQYFRRIERGYRKALTEAQQSGSLPDIEDPTRLARFYFGVHVSLCVLARAGESKAVLNDFIEESLMHIR